HPALHSFPTRRSSDLSTPNRGSVSCRDGSVVTATLSGERVTAPPRSRSTFEFKSASRIVSSSDSSQYFTSDSVRSVRGGSIGKRSEEHTSELQSRGHL